MLRSGILSGIRKAADIHDVHVDVPLSNISIAYMQSETDFIAAQVFPVVPVDKQSDVYFRFAKETFFRNRSRKWVPGTLMPQGGFDVDSSPKYSCDFNAFEYPLRWDILQNADAVLEFERASTEFVTRVLLLGREIDFATNYFAPGIWGNEYTGVAATPGANQFIYWSDYANSDPIADVKKARLAIRQNTGFRPNTFVVSEEVFEVLADHPVIKELYKYTQAGVLTKEMIARALRVDNLVVAGAVQITSPEGAVSETYDWIYGKHAWLGYVNPRPSRLMPSAGYIFAWKGMTQGFEIGVERIPDRRTKADYIQGITCYDMKVVGADLGAFFNGAVA